MPKIKPLLPEERMRNAFYVKIRSRSGELGLEKDKEIAERLLINPKTYSKKKCLRTLSGWDMDEILKACRKKLITPDDIKEILMEGMKV